MPQKINNRETYKYQIYVRLNALVILLLLLLLL